MPVVKVTEWRVEDVGLSGTEATVIDLGSRGGDRVLQGLPGSDVLSEFGQVTIDYDDEVLRLPKSS
ncbi:hypothetical protein GCM10009802_30000 [Streptomyces synnematoformans]|uniref:Uncharacterized protein n=1 Tax=Streptomyces synnematoformans TaxID=415721 RepID=A0ABP5K4X4_9ACTN